MQSEMKLTHQKDYRDYYGHSYCQKHRRYHRNTSNKRACDEQNIKKVELKTRNSLISKNLKSKNQRLRSRSKHLLKTKVKKKQIINAKARPDHSRAIAHGSELTDRPSLVSIKLDLNQIKLEINEQEMNNLISENSFPNSPNKSENPKNPKLNQPLVDPDAVLPNKLEAPIKSVSNENKQVVKSPIEKGKPVKTSSKLVPMIKVTSPSPPPLPIPPPPSLQRPSIHHITKSKNSLSEKSATNSANNLRENHKNLSKIIPPYRPPPPIPTTTKKIGHANPSNKLLSTSHTRVCDCKKNKQAKEAVDRTKINLPIKQVIVISFMLPSI
jgi:hypothetical protein